MALRWHLAPGWPSELAFPSLEGMEPVKLAPHRDVHRLRQGGHDLHVKHYRPDGREALRRWVREPKAKAELERGLELLRRGIPTLEPLAWGEDGLESWLVTRTLPGAVNLLDWLAPRPSLRQLAPALGAFLARCHEAGIRHGDLHPGNLLLRETGQGPQLYLIDLALASAGSPPTWAEAREDLLALGRWFATRFSRTDRLRGWHAYVAARRLPLDARHEARSLAEETVRSLRAVARLQDRGFRGKGRHFRRIPGGLATADAPDVLPLLASADQVIESARTLKKSASSAVVETALEGREVVLKRVDATRWTDPLAALFRPPPALHAWRMGHALCQRGVPTPRPLAVWHHHHLGLPGTGYLVMEKVAGAVHLMDHARSLAGRPSAGRELAFQLGRLVRLLHQWELSHRDLKAANLLVAPYGAKMGARWLEAAPPDGRWHLWLCDLAGVRPCPGMGLERKARDLSRLNASFLTEPTVNRPARLRALLAYLNEALAGRAGWKSWWRRIAQLTESKRQANARKGRVLG
jgi:tRNA A-37 threonylcarbamoyl transferase component Bud32